MKNMRKSVIILSGVFLFMLIFSGCGKKDNEIRPLPATMSEESPASLQGGNGVAEEADLKTPATASDADKELDQIDKDLKSVDDEDFSGSDLTEGSLNSATD
jgi:hypothetical protein